MRLSRLDLLAYGPFTKESIVFSPDKRFHILFGPNEAGKSSALRAMLSFLFGIDNNTTDDFVHDVSDLRIGGAVSARSGAELTFTRRKGRTNTLLDEHQQPIDEAVLRSFVACPNAQQFRTFYGLDQSGLRAGSEELHRLKGDLAQTLFVAGTGIADLRKFAAGLNELLGEIKPARSSTNKGLNKSIREYQELVTRRNNGVLRIEQWEELQEKIRTLSTQSAELATLLTATASTINHLERLQRSIPKAARLRLLQSQLTDLGDVIHLPADYPQVQRKAASRDLSSLASSISELEVELNGELGLNKEIRGLTIPQEILDSEEEVLDLFQRLDTYRTAQKDTAELTVRVTDRLDSARDQLNLLRSESSLEEAEANRPSITMKAHLQELSLNYGKIVGRAEATSAGIKTSTSRISEISNDLMQLPEETDTSRLKAILQSINSLGDIEASIDRRGEEAKSHQTKIIALVDSLPYWTSSVGALRSACVPLQEELDAFAERFAVIDKETQTHKERETQLKTQLQRKEAEKRNLLLLGAIPTEQRLTEARAYRQEGWLFVKSEWHGTETDVEKKDSFTAGGDLTLAYERAVQKADDIADDLRNESDRVAKLALLEADFEHLHAQEAETQEELSRLRDARGTVSSSWEDKLQASGVAQVLTPTEMKGWLSQRKAILDADDKLQALVTELNATRSTCDRSREELRAAINDLSGNVVDETLTLRQLRALAESVESAASDLAQKRRQLQKTLLELQHQIEASEAEIIRSAKAEEKFLEQWQSAMANIGLPTETTPHELQAWLQGYDELCQILDEVEGYRRRIRNMVRNAEQLQSDVAALLTTVAPDLTKLPMVHAVPALHAALVRAQQDAAKRETLTKQIAEKQHMLEQKRAQKEDLDSFLTDLCRQVGCDDHTKLPQIEELDAEFKRLKQDSEHLTSELVAEGAGQDFEQFLKEVDASSLDAISAEIHSRREEGETIKKQKEDSDMAVGEAKKELQDLQKQQSAAVLEEECQQKAAEIRRLVQTYVTTYAAYHLLNIELNEHSLQQQTPILESAGCIFSRLTLGSFSALGTSFDSQDSAILVGKRNSAEVTLAEMSDGTRDQLFLALRLAYIARELSDETKEPMPLIVDDILVNYDDDRARAAFIELADATADGQVIFLTHHKHLVELCSNALPGEILEVHSLQA